jgi:hypothetical protein
MISDINCDIIRKIVLSCEKCFENQLEQNGGKYNCQYVLTEELCPKIISSKHND